MPNWKTHLELGKRLRKNFDYDNKEYNLFLMGNILPDLNNGYMLKDRVIRPASVKIYRLKEKEVTEESNVDSESVN